MMSLQDLENAIARLTRAEKAQILQWVARDLGDAFPGMTFYGVTPEFSSKCKKVQRDKERYDFDGRAFDRIPTFRMTPLGKRELKKLTGLICQVHGEAYGWDPDMVVDEDRLREMVDESMSEPIQDRVRMTITRVVMELDEILEEEA